jgi:hypothetical protein
MKVFLVVATLVITSAVPAVADVALAQSLRHRNTVRAVFLIRTCWWIKLIAERKIRGLKTFDIRSSFRLA